MKIKTELLIKVKSVSQCKQRGPKNQASLYESVQFRSNIIPAKTVTTKMCYVLDLSLCIYFKF